jgi:hypothetical protein
MVLVMRPSSGSGVTAWRGGLHGIVHTAMAAVIGKQMTADGLEFAFALQYLARAVLNRLLSDAITFTAVCVGATDTKVMRDPLMPLLMRILGRFGTTPEASTVNIVRALTANSAAEIAGAKLPKPKLYAPERIALKSGDAAKLWTITSEIATSRGVSLP